MDKLWQAHNIYLGECIEHSQYTMETMKMLRLVTLIGKKKFHFFRNLNSRLSDTHQGKKERWSECQNY